MPKTENEKTEPVVEPIRTPKAAEAKPATDYTPVLKILEQRFNFLVEQSKKTTNIWEHYEIETAIKEVRAMYEAIAKLK